MNSATKNRKREWAHMAGVTRYENDSPCVRCGTRLRNTANYACVYCTNAAKRQTKGRPTPVSTLSDMAPVPVKRPHRRGAGSWERWSLRFLVTEQVASYSRFRSALYSGKSVGVLRGLLSDWEWWCCRLDAYFGFYPYFNDELLQRLVAREGGRRAVEASNGQVTYLGAYRTAGVGSADAALAGGVGY